jgi:hypothetical protein
MALDEVEQLLGSAGEEMDRTAITRDSTPLVQGDRFFLWKDGRTGVKIIIGFKKSKVCDKWCWSGHSL